MRVFTPSQIHRLKIEAKQLKREKGIPHSRALDEIAVAHGWTNWAALAGASYRELPASAESARAADAQSTRFYVHGDEDEEQSGRYYCEFCDRVETPEHFQSAHSEDGGKRTLAGLESWHKLPFDTKVQFFRPGKAPNLFQGVYLQPEASTTPRVRRTEASGMFRSWLCEQEWRPDSVGDFARFVRHDAEFPVSTDDVHAIREHLRIATAKEVGFFEEAWEDFCEAVGARG